MTIDWNKKVSGYYIKLNLTYDVPPHWCEKGHYGYLIEGQMEIEYENEKIIYNPGDGIFIPDGPKHKHKGKVLSKKALVFFMEKV